MKIKHICGAAAALTAFATASAFAQQTRETPNPWLDCGIGALIFPSANLEVGAGLSNIIWDLGTTAVTSAQSSPDTCNGLDNVTSAAFIQRTYPTLEKELARGYGDNLNALAKIVGAEDDAAFVASLRQEMATEIAAPAFAELSYDEKAQALYFAAQRVAG
ncbi:MAG: DUF3015 family protein [Parvularculaceae bacterium]|nr:DUF3015 family protein [Parvularculaceae bacterium]